MLTSQQKNTLKQLGLNDGQIILYLTSLQHGLLTVIELAKHTGFSRQKIYELAQQMVELGVYDITRKQKRKYIPARPDTLFNIAEKKVREAEKTLTDLSTLVPILKSLKQVSKGQVKTKYYEGQQGVKRAFEDELASCNNLEALFIAGSIDDVLKFFPEKYWDRWNRQFVKQGSHSRMLVHNSAAAKNICRSDKSHGRESRFFDDLPLKANVDIFGDNILIVSFYDEVAIRIESPILADSYRALFNKLWSFAKPISLH